MKNHQLEVIEVRYKRQYTKGVVIGTYSNLYELKKSPCFATLLGNGGTLSEVTRRKGGVVWIPLNRFDGVKKLKVILGKGKHYKYEVWRNIVVRDGGFMVTANITTYDKQGEVIAQLN